MLFNIQWQTAVPATSQHIHRIYVRTRAHCVLFPCRPAVLYMYAYVKCQISQLSKNTALLGFQTSILHFFLYLLCISCFIPSFILATFLPFLLPSFLLSCFSPSFRSFFYPSLFYPSARLYFYLLMYSSHFPITTSRPPNHPSPSTSPLFL